MFQVFDRVRKEYPNFHKKFLPVYGDITSPDLGISEEDASMLSENVHVVFHSAATIRFDEPLR